MVFLALPPRYWEYRHIPAPAVVYGVLWFMPRVLYMISKLNSINQFKVCLSEGFPLLCCFGLLRAGSHYIAHPNGLRLEIKHYHLFDWNRALIWIYGHRPQFPSWESWEISTQQMNMLSEHNQSAHLNATWQLALGAFGLHKDNRMTPALVTVLG